MRQAGMSPAAIIEAATRNAARVCGLGDRLGTVEAGKVADLLVVRGDPLADLDALTDVRLVMRSGVIIRDEGAETRGRS
jgi:imidazolonepropionase-like amidohydrolase